MNPGAVAEGKKGERLNTMRGSLGGKTLWDKS